MRDANDAAVRSDVSACQLSDASNSDFGYALSLDTVCMKYNASRYGYRFMKRMFDIAFSFAICVIGLLPGLILCLIICLDSRGLPLFRQTRIGRGARPIHILKFRSMYSDAHEHPERYLNAEQMKQWIREQKVNDDPRITRVGRLLRKTSLDELPQFVNVLFGDMSVVGPRPVTYQETLEFGEHRDLVLSVRPGITGLWQVTERNNATWENGSRQHLELSYVFQCGPLLDLKIIGGTVKAVFRKTGK